MFRKLRLSTANITFQQDGAPLHLCNVIRQSLNDQFPNKWVGSGDHISWSPRSSDYGILDFIFVVVVGLCKG